MIGNIPIKEFDAAKQAKFFDALKNSQFSGQFLLEDPTGQKWSFFLYLGRLLYATGGNHPVRRWLRNVGAACPHIDRPMLREMTTLSDADVKGLAGCWEYELLRLWVETKQISREQASQVITGIVCEILFDVTQSPQVIFLTEPNTPLKQQLVFLDTRKLVGEVEKQWLSWQRAKVADRMPNQAPVIKNLEKLRQQTSPSSYQALVRLLNGSYTLRDIAINRKRDIVDIITLLLSYIQSGVVELHDIHDLPIPISNLPQAIAKPPVIDSAADKNTPLIACVDDSPAVCQAMEKILLSAKFRFIAIQNPLRAIATLLARKPDLIFLDLVMPDTNGYEICAQLRKISSFRNTPIIILTGNDGVIDRVRAKVVGSSDFLAKPVDAETVLSVTYRHLKPSAKIDGSTVVG
jgi:two-component system, chemotaxis family, response regulator PixG